MEALHRLADTLDDAATAVTAAATSIDGQGGPALLGGDSPGRVGDIGRQLQALWTAALCARRGEADRLGAELTDTADALRRAAGSYAAADTAARDRLIRGGP
jgi:hypothetical protein